MSDADLENATLSGAAIGGTIWNDTTCPDGTNSDSHIKGCEDHLR